MAYIISEESSIVSAPVIKGKFKNRDWIRMECILQTAGDINKNKRRYKKEILESGLSTVYERIADGSFLGELDHPIDTRPMRQVSVLFKEASHRILETWWEGNILKSVVETLDTPNGHILRNIAIQGVPVGWSFRGMGEVKPVSESGGNFYDVTGPLVVITWDAVSNPSHKQARLVKITESVQDEINECLQETSQKFIHEQDGLVEKNGMICTKEGICYLPNQFDEFVQKRVVKLVNKYKG